MVFWKRKDIALGEQTVTELTILEWKRFFSIKLFNFHPTTGKQDRFHTHAFNALSIRLSGDYTEEIIIDDYVIHKARSRKRFLFIPANEFHRITKSNGCKTLLITGPWGSQFKELRSLFPSQHEGYSWWSEWVCGAQRKDLQKLPHSRLLKGA